MTVYRKAATDVAWSATKWDNFTIEATGKPYKTQKGSGRNAVFALIKAGMSVGAWTKEAVKHGFDPKFVTGSLLKHQEGETAAFKMSAKDSNGRPFDEVKKIRQVDPAKAAEREAKAKAREEAKAKTAAEKEAKAKAKAAEKEQKAEAKSKTKTKGSTGAREAA